MSVKSKEMMRPFQEVGFLGQIKGVVSVVIPTSYLNDAMRISMEYVITDQSFCNRVDLAKIFRCYSTGEEWPLNNPVELVLDNEILANVSMVLSYFKHVHDFLVKENKKEAPPRFDDFMKSQGGLGLSIPFFSHE